jgi:hypothetical protein
MGAGLLRHALGARRVRAQSLGPLLPDPDGILDLPED